MKITTTVIARSLVGDATLVSTSSRDARERMTIDTSTDATRVHVEMRADGTAYVTFFKRATGATAADGSIGWIEDTSVVFDPATETRIITDRSLAF